MANRGSSVSSGLGVASVALVLFAAAGTNAQFTSHNVTLLSWLDLPAFASNPEGGNDCWGYVSATGREYALVGLRNAFAVVEITDPINPVIIAEVSPHDDCRWGDMKVYQNYCYYGNGCGGGIDIYDLSDVDNGIVTLVGQLPGGVTDTHNIAIDADSGFLYLCASNLNNQRLVAFDLADPENPTLAGEVPPDEGVLAHDAQVVTYTSGPNAGKQIAFVPTGDAGLGLDIYDVTDKSNMFRLSRTAYFKAKYGHQCWLGPNRQFLYVNDEVDLINRTVIFDVSDLSDPQVVHTYTSGTTARDHNGYIRDGFIYETKNRAGLRIFCLEQPLNPVQVGWFDTHPEDDIDDPDHTGKGAWSNYPFLPSGNVIVTDRNRGLFVFDVSDALSAGGLFVEYPNGRPNLLVAQGGSAIRVDVGSVCGGAHSAGTGLLHYDDGSGFVSIPMVVVDADSYDAVFPALRCGGDVTYYITVEDTAGTVFTDPVGATVNTGPYLATATFNVNVVFEDTFETDNGWVSQNLGATGGDWERGVPVDDPNWAYDPGADGDGSGQCFLTENALGDTDVDGGFTRLISPVLDISAGNIMISYEHFARMTVPNLFDGMRVEINSNGGAGAWTEIFRHQRDLGLSWVHYDITPDQLADAGVTLNSNMKVRFTAADGSPESIVELGVDGFKITELVCICPWDCDGNNDGIVGVTDLLALLGQYDPMSPNNCTGGSCDFDGSGCVDIVDLLKLLAHYDPAGVGCP